MQPRRGRNRARVGNFHEAIDDGKVHRVTLYSFKMLDDLSDKYPISASCANDPQSKYSRQTRENSK
jgi:hypothetical protein